MAAYRINIAAYGRLGRRYARDWFKVRKLPGGKYQVRL